MNVHVVDGHFSECPTATWIMHARAKKYGICVGEALYRIIGEVPYYKVYISIRRDLLPEKANIFMSVEIGGAVLCSSEESSQVYEIPAKFYTSMRDDFVKRVKEAFKFLA